MSDQLLSDILKELRRVTAIMERQTPQQAPAAQPLRSPKEAAALLGVSVATVIRRLHAGEWPGYRVGRHYKVNVEEVQAVTAMKEREPFDLPSAAHDPVQYPPRHPRRNAKSDSVVYNPRFVPHRRKPNTP
jgi:excisionase family DNA binding protein